MGVSKRRVKGSQRGKKGQRPLDDERYSGLSAIQICRGFRLTMVIM